MAEMGVADVETLSWGQDEALELFEVASELREVVEVIVGLKMLENDINDDN